MAARTSKRTDLSTVVASIEPGSSVCLGGAVHSNRPAAFVRELIRQRKGPLVLYSSPGSGWDADLLIGCGLVSKAILPMVTMAEYGLAPSFRHAVETGGLDAPNLDAMSQLAGYLAAGYGHPFHFIRSIEGTDIVRDESLFDVVTDSAGVKHRVVRALAPDLFVMHVEECDEFGNARHLRGRAADVMIARASRRTIVTTDKIISNDEVRRDPQLTTVSGNFVHGVIEVPWGAHPTSTARYGSDEDHLAAYHRAATQRAAGQPEAFDAYLEQYVFPDETSYLEQVGGVERMHELEFDCD